MKYAYKTSETADNRYDIYEIGGEIIAMSVPWDYVDDIVYFLNSENKCKNFESNNKTSSATICKHCGKEKFTH